MRKKEPKADRGSRRALREAKEAVELQKAELQAILDNIDSGISVINRSGNHVYANDAQAKIFGFEGAEQMALKWDDLTEGFTVQTFPDHSDLVPEEWPVSRVLAGEDLDSAVYCIKRRDKGLEKIVIISGSPVCNAQGEAEFAVIAVHDISELTRAQENAARRMQELQQANRKILFEQTLFHALMDSLPVSVYFKDRDSRFLNVNRLCAEGKGINDAAELIGKTDFDFYPEEQARPRYEQEQNILQTEKPVQLEERSFDRWLLTTKAPWYDEDGNVAGTFGVSLDITDHKRADEELRKAKEDAEGKQAQLQAILDNVYDGISVIDRSRKHVYRNDESARIYGFESVADADQAGKRLGREYLEEMLSVETFPDGRHIPPEQWPPNRVLAGERVKDEFYTIRRKDLGMEKIVDISGTPVCNTNGDVVLAVLATHDITGRVKREEEEKLLVQRMEQARMESLGVLAGGIAHDFNNLLMAILGHADLALLEISELSPAVENLNNIRNSSLRAADLCTQLLAYTGQGRMEEKTFSMSRLVDEMVKILKTSISKKCVLNLHLDDRLPMTQGDPSQMRQIIMNFVINASDAIGERSGVINISTGVMDCSQEELVAGYVVEPKASGLYVTLEVSDNGHGMDKQVLRRIFEPFFTTKFTGRGLGLSAVLGIIRSHGGGLQVYSEPGRGTTFKVLMPAVESDVTDPGGEKKTPPATRMKFSGTVLLVDDEESVRAVCGSQLKALGLNVITASDGREGLDVFREKRDEVDLVILDLTMPRMDGEEAFREMRALDPDIKIVLASGYAEADVTARFAGKNLSGFLRKPYTLKGLASILADLLPDS